MRYRNLIEAPIGDLEVHHMDKPGTFPDVDRKLLTNPKHIEKIRHRFAQTPFSFNVYFVNQQDAAYLQKTKTDGVGFSDRWFSDLYKFAGLQTSETIANTFGVKVAPDPQAITVVYLSNANVNDSIPMTPWTIAHRFGHAITDRVKRLPPNARQPLSRLPIAGDSIDLGNQQHVVIGWLLTMRSARQDLLGDDVREEMIAQYLLQGGVTLQIPDFDRTEFISKNPTRAKDLLLKKQQVYNQLIERLLTACMGHIFVAV